MRKKISTKFIGTAAATTAIVMTGAYFFLSVGKGQQIQVPAYTVSRVIDGDTFETVEKQLIRLSSVDAPELDLCWGKEAKKALKKLVLGKPLYLKVQYRDHFYRLISVVYTPAGSVNEAMVRNGDGYYAKSGQDMGTEMLSAAQEARDNHRGIFSSVCTQQTNPLNPSCQIKGNARHPNIYYTPDCGMYTQVDVQLYMGDRWFCTEKEAQQAGYRKPSQCP